MQTGTAERLEVREGFVKPVIAAADIIDIMRDAMEALQPEPHYIGQDKQLVYDELASVLDFFGAAHLND